MKTILVPTDFSDNATNALNYAAALASQVRGKLIIAHIINLPVTPIESGFVFSTNAQLEEDYKQELNRLSKELRLENGFRFEVETVCQYGYFLANLNELVKNEDVDLVVMGTKGATNFLDKIVGTNTSEFIRIAACPVLTIPQDAKFTGFKHIAYASDFEHKETSFLQQLFCITEPFGAAVSIINILSERQLNIFSDNQVIRNIAKRFPENSYSLVQLPENNVVKGLYEFVADNQAEVLAVSIHDRNFLESLFHKSISKQLLYQTKLPILALPENAYCQSLLKAKTQKPELTPLKNLHYAG